MRQCLPATVAAVVVALGAQAARAAVIPNYSFTTELVGFPAGAAEPSVEFSVGVFDLVDPWPDGPLDPSPPASARRPIFDRLQLDADDVGRTFFVPASEIPGAVALLTNGVNNVVRYEALAGDTGPRAGTYMEWPYFFAAPGQPPEGTDFAGHGLTEIGVRVDELGLNPATSLNEFSFTLIVLPEPSAVAPLGLCGLALPRRRRAAR
jgi:hypothetical protein